jgi:DNA-binding transcriptional MerR regulator
MPNAEIFVVTPDLREVLDKLPAGAPRSRLEPFRAFILRWRREGRSYEEIRLILQEKCRVRATKSTIFEFVERRSRKRKLNLEPQVEEQSMAAIPVEQVTRLSKKLTSEERAAQVEFIRSLNKPAPEEQPKPGWNFDVDKPRTIQKP